MKRFLFNFNMAYLYTFIAGILVSLAANLFTTTFLAESLPVNVYRIYGIVLSLFISSVSAFGISALLENARRDWELGGFQQDSGVIEGFIKTRIGLMKFFVVIFLLGIIASAILGIDALFNYHIRFFNKG